MLLFAHGRFRRRPKLWNVRALIGAVAVAAEKPSFAEQSAVETKSGAPHGEFPRKLCCIKANGGGMLAGAIPQGPGENRKSSARRTGSMAKELRPRCSHRWPPTPAPPLRVKRSETGRAKRAASSRDVRRKPKTKLSADRAPRSCFAPEWQIRMSGSRRSLVMRESLAQARSLLRRPLFFRFEVGDDVWKWKAEILHAQPSQPALLAFL
jgi:hypothetical protein